jgi:hypothetical protein
MIRSEVIQIVTERPFPCAACYAIAASSSGTGATGESRPRPPAGAILAPALRDRNTELQLLAGFLRRTTDAGQTATDKLAVG